MASSSIGSVVEGTTTETAAATGAAKLYPVGMLQQIQVSQQRGVQPVQAIGSGRNYFLAGKPSVNFSIGRLFARGPNLHRALYKNVFNADSSMALNEQEPAHADGYADGVFNLDSELFLVPFGIAIAFRDKSGGNLGSFFIESCMISSYQLGIASGNNVIMENVNGMADRILPVNLSVDSTGNFFRGGAATGGNVVGNANATIPTAPAAS